MFKYLFKGILSAMAVKILDDYRHLSIRLLKIEATKSYLRGVQMARLSAMGLVWVAFMIGLVCIGVLIFHAGLFILLPWTMEAKAILGMCLGLAYVVIGGVVLCATMDEKKWMEKSGAAEMLKDALDQSEKD